jgi:hypothetical protein
VVEDWRAEFNKLNNRPGPPPGERRRSARFAIYDASVKLYRRGATALFGLARLSIEGTAMGLSEDGADLVVGEQLLPDTKIHLRIDIAKFEDRIETDAVVRWCHKDLKAEGRYAVGVEFAAVDPLLARKVAQMKGWFTSAQAVAMREQRLREERRPPG